MLGKSLKPSGRPNFQELQNARLTKLPIIYYVFDLLHVKGCDLLGRPLSERREQLQQLATGFTDPLRLNTEFHVSLSAFEATVRRLGLEGIVAKRSDSIYIPGKESDAWRKHRFNQEDEFVIGGYIPGGQNFSELLIGEDRDAPASKSVPGSPAEAGAASAGVRVPAAVAAGSSLIFIKRLIAGFTPHTRAEVFDAIKALRTPKCPFANLPERGKSPHALTEEVMRQCVWVKPEH